MKTNLSNLMNLVSQLEKDFSDKTYSIKEYAYNRSIQELDGTINVIEDYKEDFDEVFKEFKENQEKMIKYKSAIYERNNSYKLPDGRTIQEAIAENTMLRKVKNVYAYLANLRNSKRRETEVNNSYFDCKTVNYDVKELKAECERIEKRIQETEFEISKLNSIEFEI